MQFPSSVASISLKSSHARSVSGRWFWIVLIFLAVAGYLIYQARSRADLAYDRELEVRLDFIPFQPRREFRDSLSMTLRGDGKVRVIHHRREMYVDAVYEGTLPEADALRFVARARQAAAVKGLTSTRDDALFSMVVLPAGSSDEQSIFGGQLGDAPKSTRDLVEDLLALWNRLDKAAPAEAYLRAVPFVEAQLKRMQQNEQRRFLSVSEFPADLQEVVTESLNHPRDFVPVTRAQHDQLLHYRQFVIKAKGFSHRLALLLPPPNPAN